MGNMNQKDNRAGEMRNIHVLPKNLALKFLVLGVLSGTALWCFVFLMPNQDAILGDSRVVRSWSLAHAKAEDIWFLILTLLGTWLIAAAYIASASFAVWVAKLIIPSKWLRVAVQFLVVTGFVLYVPWGFRENFINPLPKDEEIIAHFYTHKAEIEAYVNYRREGGAYDKAMEQKAGIAVFGWGDNIGGGAWLPDPYSIETARKSYDTWKRRSSNEGREGKPSKGAPYAALSIRLDGRLGEYAHPVRFGAFNKELWHVPVVPKIENGYLLWPLTKAYRRPNGQLELAYPWLDKDGHGKNADPLQEEWVPSAKRRVFDSLDSYPPDYWLKGECVFRRIEAQWFIVMCRPY